MESLSPEEQRKLYDTVLIMHTELEILNSQGCPIGRKMHEVLKTEMKKDIENASKYYKIASGISVAVGAILTYLWKVL